MSPRFWNDCWRIRIAGLIAGFLVAFCADRGVAAPPASGMLLDFNDRALFASVRVTGNSTIEPAEESREGQHAAKIVFAPPPEGLGDFPSVFIEGEALKIRDFSPYEALCFWVRNPGPDDAELSLSIADQNGRQAFSNPPSVTIKPGRWEQILSRFTLEGLDRTQISAVRLFQKNNHRPASLLIAEVQLLSPYSTRLAGQRQALYNARENARELGAQRAVEPEIAELSHGLDLLEASAPATANLASPEREAEFSRIAAAAQELSRAITIRSRENGGKTFILSGPRVVGGWLDDPEKLESIADLTLSNTALGDDAYPLLAPARNLEVLNLESSRFTGAGLEKMKGGKLRRLVMSSTGATDESLQGIRGLPGLEELLLAETRVTSGVFQHLDGLEHLRHLSLTHTRVSGEGFAAIGKLTSLEILNLSRTAIHGESLHSLDGLTKLKTLNLNDTPIHDGDLPHLSKLPQLEHLTLENVPITGAGLEQLTGMEKLIGLDLDGTRIGDAGLQKFGKLPRLHELSLSGTRVSDASVTQILTGAHLTFLNLFQTNITDSALEPLLKMPSMDSMFLGDTQITDVALSYMRNLKALHALDLEGTQITDAGLQYLDGINMALLHIGKTRITAEGMKHIKTLTGLYNLDLSGTSVTDDSLANLASLPHVIFLNLSATRVTSKGMTYLHGSFVNLNLEATRVGDEGIEVLSALPKILRLNLNETATTDAGLKLLRKRGEINMLNLRGTRITDAGLTDLGNNLGELDLSHNTRITDQGVENLVHCAQLSRLGLAFTGVTGEAVKSLQALPKLTALDLSGTAIDDLGVQRLALLPQLKELNLSGTLVSDQAIDALLKMPHLRRLSLEGSRITFQGVSRLRSSAPECTVDLVFPFAWGEPWSYYDAPAPSHAAASWANPAAFLQQMKSLQGLRYLRVDDALLAPDVLRSLKDLPALEEVSFAKTPLTDETLAGLTAPSRLAHLDLSHTRITDLGLRHLQDFPALSDVNLAGDRINGSGFLHLAHPGRLGALNLANTLLDDQGAAHLATLKELRKLEAGGTRLTDAAIASLAQLPHLEYLDLYGTRVTDAGVARLDRMTTLRYCYLTDTRITDAGIEHLRGLADLEELGLDGTQLTDDELGRLTALTHLRRLRIGRTNVTAAGLSPLGRLPKLESLGLAGLPVTNSGLEVLAQLPALQSLDLSGTKIDDGALAVLARFPALNALDVRGAGLSAAALEGFRHAHPRIGLIAAEPPRHYPAGAAIIAILYSLAACAICLYGIHRCWLTWRLLRDRAATRKQPEPAGHFTPLPRVTVQLPMFNERNVAERIIEAVCALDYPRDLLQIQVLDDSNDDSADIARRCCERLAAAGNPVEYLHRPGREGFKSGAMAAGLKTATGEFVAVFDADFLPAPDFLRMTIDYFTDPAVGMVQTRWAHLNRGESWLTHLQAVFLDGHLVVEQAVRSHCGRWFNFNGTAGVWRRRCIEESGGWQHDTLTEDTDLSYRAQIAGWKFLYLPAAHCQAELPSTMTAFLGQQHRWTKGLIQTARKLLPRILASKAPWKIKLEAWIHLTSPIMYLVMFLIAAIALPAMFLATPFTERGGLALGVGFGALLLGTFGSAAFYAVSQRVQGFSLLRTLLKIPPLMALGIGVCAVNSRAVVEALLGIRSPFVRTPKFGARGDCAPDQAVSGWPFPRGLLELLMAGVLYAGVVLSFQRPFTLIGSPFLLLFALGYSVVGLARVLDPYAAPLRRSAPPAPARRRSPLLRIAAGATGVLLLAGISAAALRLASATALERGPGQPAALGLDLTAAHWQAIPAPTQGASHGAIKNVRLDRGSVFLDVEFDEKTDEGAIDLALDSAMQPLGDSLGQGRRLTFQVEYPPRFTGEFQAFVKDRQGRSEYGNMQIIERFEEPRPVTVALIPSERMPAMGYQEKGFAPESGIRQIGIKISAQSDRVRGARYQPFRGTIRIAGVQVSDFDRSTFPAPETLPAAREPQPLPILTKDAFLAGSGVDRPWPIGYAFSGPVTSTHKEELERTYTALEAKGCRFTRVYVGDYRTGLVFDGRGHAAGVTPEFLDYFDQLAEIANHHGVTVMFSLTDNAMLNRRHTESIGYVREGEASDAFVDHVLVELIRKLQGRQVIWDLFNEPENTITVPLREIQAYVGRVLIAGRRADPHAKFTVVSRSRPEVIYWQGRGLDLYSHNIFNPRLLEESLTAPRALDAPIMVAEMAPELASVGNLDALREAGYAGIGIWGWGTQDKYEWASADLERIVTPLLRLR